MQHESALLLLADSSPTGLQQYAGVIEFDFEIRKVE